MEEKTRAVQCKHSIRSKGKNLDTFLNFYQRRQLWSMKGMQNFICMCTHCGILICPPTWCMIIEGIVNIELYMIMYYYIAFIITFGIFGSSLVMYATISVFMHIVMYALIQKAVKSALILAFPWVPLQSQQNNVKQAERLYNSYVRGQQIGMCLNIVALICVLIW